MSDPHPLGPTVSSDNFALGTEASRQTQASCGDATSFFLRFEANDGSDTTPAGTSRDVKVQMYFDSSTTSNNGDQDIGWVCRSGGCQNKVLVNYGPIRQPEFLQTYTDPDDGKLRLLDNTTNPIAGSDPVKDIPDFAYGCTGSVLDPQGCIQQEANNAPVPVGRGTCPTHSTCDQYYDGNPSPSNCDAGFKVS